MKLKVLKRAVNDCCVRRKASTNEECRTWRLIKLFLISLAIIFGYAHFKLYIFALNFTNSSNGIKLVSSFNLLITFALTGLYREWVLGYALVSKCWRFLAMSSYKSYVCIFYERLSLSVNRSLALSLTLYTTITKVVHEHFRQLQQYETSVNWFRLHNCLFGELDHDEIVVYISEIFNGWFR